jgi:hypothetical protein
LNVEATPYEDQGPVIEARQQCLAAYDAALKASDPMEVQRNLEVAREFERHWNTASEAEMALANPIFDPPPVSSNSRIRALEMDFSSIG